MKILHGVGNAVEVLYGSVADGVLTFKTSSLSPFAVVTSAETAQQPGGASDDTAAPGQDGSTDAATAADDAVDSTESIPKTGDNWWNIWLPALAMATAGVGILIALLYKKARALDGGDPAGGRNWPSRFLHFLFNLFVRRAMRCLCDK